MMKDPVGETLFKTGYREGQQDYLLGNEMRFQTGNGQYDQGYTAGYTDAQMSAESGKKEAK